MPVRVWPKDLSCKWLYANDVAHFGFAASATHKRVGRWRNHDRMVRSVHLYDGRAHITDKTERGRCPFHIPGDLFVSHNTGFWRLRGHNEQVAVNERILGDCPDRESALRPACSPLSRSIRRAAAGCSSKIGPNVLMPDRFVGVDVYAVKVAVVTA